MGGEYRSTREPGIGVPSGIKRVFEVPVWDQTQGLGQRMPNLMGQQSQTPFVFLARFFSVDTLILIRVFSSTFVGLSLINLVLSSWGNSKIWSRILFLDLSLLGPLFLYTLKNDFFSQADQFWGLSLILVGFMHPDYFPRDSSRVAKFSNLSLGCFLFGGFFLIAGHPSWLLMGILAVLPLLILRPFLGVVQLGSRKILCLVTILLFLILQIFELLTNAAQDVGTYYADSSVWDVTSCNRLRCVVFPPIAAGAQPFLRLINQAGDRNEFFNAGFVVLISVAAFRPRIHLSNLQAFLRKVLLALAFLIFVLVFGYRISTAEIALISQLFTFHSWQLAAPMLTIVTFAATVTLGHPEILKSWIGLISKLIKILTAVSVVIALLNPLVMGSFQTSTSKSAYFGQSAETRRDPLLKLSELVVKSERIAFVEAQSDSGEYGDPLFREIIDLPFELRAARAGYPTIQFFSAGRTSETLVGLQEIFRSRFAPDLTHCKPEVLEFLAVSSIFVNTEDTSGCREKLLAYFGEDSVREINKVAGPPGTASLFRPKSFATWSIVTDSAENPSVSCPLLEQDCLKGLEVTKLPSTGQAPFRLCENECLFTYKWATTANTKQVLLPVNFDKTLEIKDRLTGKRLETANYQGLLAVQVDGNETGGVFTGNIRPDLMMWLRVAMTYLHTIVFLGALGAMLVKGVRAVKEISRAPESQPIS